MTEHYPELLDVPEAAAVAHLKQSTIRKWIYLRKLQYVKLGRRVFIRRKDLNSLIAQSVVPAEKKAPARVVAANKNEVTGGA